MSVLREVVQGPPFTEPTCLELSWTEMFEVGKEDRDYRFCTLLAGYC